MTTRSLRYSKLKKTAALLAIVTAHAIKMLFLRVNVKVQGDLLFSQVKWYLVYLLFYHESVVI